MHVTEIAPPQGAINRAPTPISNIWILMDDHQDNNEVELVDLDTGKVADVPEPSWAKQRALMWQQLLTRRRARSLEALALAALLAIVVLLSISNGWLGNLVVLFRPSAGRPSSSIAPAPTIGVKVSKVLLPQQAGLVCLADAAWSPDSRSIAMIGYQKACLNEGTPNGPGTLVIYEARSGKLEERLSTDNLIISAFHRQFPRDRGAPILEYLKVLWSPDGSRLALPFWIVFDKRTQNGYNIILGYSGLLLYTRSGAQAQIFLATQTTNFMFAEWDTTQGRIIQSSAGNSLFLANPLAAAYRWGSDGMLLPLDMHTRTLNPVGNPQGGAAFTIWQPGTVQINPPYNGPGSQQSATYAFNTFFSAWSPDGRYIATISIFAHLVLPGQPVPPYPWPNVQHSIPPPNINMRSGDVAFQHALKIITGALVPSYLIMLSWRLDGRALAIYDASTTELEILDCATGDQTASLLLSTNVPPGKLTGSYLLYWSPDSKRLLMFDPDVGQVLTWNVG